MKIPPSNTVNIGPGPGSLLDRGCCAWQLPIDPTCAVAARSLLEPELVRLPLPSDLIGDVATMVSELATNAWLHGFARERRSDGSLSPVGCPAELWAYVRVRPTAQLVIKVYDPCPEWIDHEPADPDDEHGRGLGIVQTLSTEWGWHPTLSRLAPTATPGKAVYFAVPAPGLYHRAAAPFIPAPEAAGALYQHLAARGLRGLQLNHGNGRSLVSLSSGFTVWSENPGIYRWRDSSGQYRSRPYIDLIDVTEITVRLHTERGSSASP